MRPRSDSRIAANLDHALFPRLNREGVRTAHTDLRDLVERGRAAVVVDLDVVEQRRARAPGTDLREFFAQGFNRAAHLEFGLLEMFGSCHFLDFSGN